MRFRSVLRLSVLATAVSASACATVPCAPPLGESAAQVVARCGQPAEVFSAPVGEIVHEEWRYGDTYVGMIAGSVSYVLK